jgi:hypothetical protein
MVAGTAVVVQATVSKIKSSGNKARCHGPNLECEDGFLPSFTHAKAGRAWEAKFCLGSRYGSFSPTGSAPV